MDLPRAPAGSAPGSVHTAAPRLVTAAWSSCLRSRSNPSVAILLTILADGDDGRQPGPRVRETAPKPTASARGARVFPTVRHRNPAVVLSPFAHRPARRTRESRDPGRRSRHEDLRGDQHQAQADG